MNRYAAALIRPVGLRALLLKERLRTGVTYNPISRANRLDPYPVYHQLRAKDPVHWSELIRGWVLTRYSDVATVLRDPRFSANRANALATSADAALEASPYMRNFAKTLLSIDPPDHTRLRNLVNKAFTPRAVEVLRPRMEEIVEGLLDEVQVHGRMDVIRDLAYPLPVIVIAELLGVPPEERDRFKRWSDDLAEGIEPLIEPEMLKRADRSIVELMDYFREVIRDRRRNPREDMVSRLVAVEDAGDRLNEEELFGLLTLLLAAGNETTTNLIGNGLLALLRQPDQLRRLRDDPSLVESSVEELLRYDSPVQMTGRVALEDIELGGRLIRAGQFAVTLLGAANRDPAQFVDPDRIDVGRRENRHVAFGLGIHFCLGAPLARLEGQTAFRALLRRLPEPRLDGEPRWRQTLTLRGLQSLPVRFQPSAPSR